MWTAAMQKMDWTQQKPGRGGRVRIPQEDGKDSHSFPKGTEFSPRQNPPTMPKPAALWIMGVAWARDRNQGQLR